MLGARAVRVQREKRKSRLLRREQTLPYPYIPPFGERFDREEVPYFKHRSKIISRQRERETEDKSKKKVDNLSCSKRTY